MSSSIDYLAYILDLLRDLDNISYKKMMGEYLLYKDGVLFGGIYDNRFLIKKTKSLMDLGLKEEIPYESAKPMFLVETEDHFLVSELVLKVVSDLI